MDRNPYLTNYHFTGLNVALRKESVDRNCDLEPIKNPEAVALRKESVDRNVILPVALLSSAVALRKESVDRNEANSYE